MLGEPVADRTGREGLAGDLEAAFAGQVLRRQGLQQPVAQDAELQPVEQLVDGLAVPVPPGQIGRPDRQFEVTDQGVQFPVADHVGQVLPQRCARLAGQLVRAPDEVLQPVIGLQPLRGRLRPDAGDTGQVVAALPHQRRQLRVAARRDEVALDHRGRIEPGQVGHALARVEHGHLVVDPLEGVPVAGADQGVQPGP